MKNKEMSLLHKALDEENWQKARSLIRKLLKEEPDSYWGLAQLSSTYYEQHRYKKALEVIEKAMKIAPSEPLVMWHYAGALDMLRCSEEAIEVYKKIIRKGISKIAFIDTTEGIRWAKSLINDCRYRIGLCYRDLGNLQLATKWLRQHLQNRCPGIPSVYKISEARKKLNDLKQV